METAYKTKLFRSVLDCGCNLSLGEFAEEAEIEDVKPWLEERGYGLKRLDPNRIDGVTRSEAEPL